MVIADFNIICLGAKKPDIYVDPRIHTEWNDRYNLNSPPYYKDNWEIVSLFRGIWYSIEPAERLTLNYEHEIFDLGTKGINICSSRGREIKLSSVRVTPPFEGLFPNLIKYYVNLSPIKTICLLLRLQGKEDEIHFGPLNISRFMCMLNEDKVMFNAVYFISDLSIPNGVQFT